MLNSASRLSKKGACMSDKEPIYRIIFFQQGKTYEIYAKYISEDNLMGFIEVEELVFSEPDSKAVVVDPSEEKLKSEFKDVKRSYIPMHTIVRIDEVIKEGQARIKDSNDKSDSISNFPNIHANYLREKE